MTTLPVERMRYFSLTIAAILISSTMLAVSVSLISNMPDKGVNGDPTPVRTLTLTPHDPILIQGDLNFTSANGVTRGDGSLSDPYVIEGWSIDASLVNGIEICDTMAYCVVRNLTILDGTWTQDCLLIVNSSHAAVENVTALSGGNGFRIESCSGALVRDSNLVDCWNGIQMVFTDLCSLKDNRFQDNWMGVEVYDSTNASLFSNSFIDDGIAILGDSFYPETYDSHTIPFNNTVNGRPVLFYTHQSGLTLDGVDAGQLIFMSCTDVRISNVTLSNTSEGVQMGLCDGVTISDSSIENCSHGSVMVWCTNVTAVNNTCRNIGGVNLAFAQCRNVLVHVNQLYDGGYEGVEIHNCWNATVSSNVIHNMSFMYGIMTTSEDVNITGNELTECSIQAYALAGSNVSIWPDNTVNGNPVLCYVGLTGVQVDSVDVGQLIVIDCVGVSIANISISGDYAGVSAYDVTGLTIINSTFTGNSIGIDVAFCTDLLLAQNVMSGNAYYGASIQYSEGCVVYGNSISDNGLGLRLINDNNVTVFRNTFQGNSLQATENSSTNISWDAGYPQGGNFWSDYTGTDIYSGPTQDIPGSDAIGDTPYDIEAGASDKYPLMEVPVVAPIPEFGMMPFVVIALLVAVLLTREAGRRKSH